MHNILSQKQTKLFFFNVASSLKVEKRDFVAKKRDFVAKVTFSLEAQLVINRAGILTHFVNLTFVVIPSGFSYLVSL